MILEIVKKSLNVYSEYKTRLSRSLEDASIAPTLLIRLVFISAAFVSAVVRYFSDHESTLMWLCGAIFFVTAMMLHHELKNKNHVVDLKSGAWKVFFDKPPSGLLHSIFQLLIDPVLIAGAVWVTGASNSPFQFLFLLPVACAGVFLGRTTALFLGLFSTILYLTMLLVTSYNKFSLDLLVHSPALIQSLGLLSACVLVGVLTDFLRGRARKASELVQKTQREVEEIKNEAFKAHKDLSKLRKIEEKLFSHESLTKLLSSSWGANEAKDHRTFSMPLGESEGIREIREIIKKVGPSDANVLVLGESGTGKERVAKALHEVSERRDRPFVPINCGAIPESLIESELFGHKKGSFTGADRDTLGLFRAAEGGTIFLDEVGELPLSMQAKLLRVLQEKIVHPVGADSDIPVNVRVLAATNKDISKEVGAGRFREDLFFRLNVIEIKIPPLRERKEDLPLLIELFVRRFSDDSPTPPMISPTAMEFLLNYSYPGNIRELENVLERAVVLGGDGILPEHLPEGLIEKVTKLQNVAVPSDKTPTDIFEMDNVQLPADLDKILLSVEKAYLEEALKNSGGVKKRAAELLGMNFRSLRYRLSKFGLGEDGVE